MKITHLNIKLVSTPQLIPTLVFCFSFMLYQSNAVAASTEQPKLQLATLYDEPEDINQYWISEKLDGVRGYWTGSELLTKRGNPINTPNGYTDNWPKIPMEGELWSTRNSFEKISGCVRQKTPTSCWHNIKLYLFDLPHHSAPFSQRIKAMDKLVKQANNPTLQVVTQYRVASIEQLFNDLDRVVKHSGEGLMLHHQQAKYGVGRSKDVMKLKRYQDAEAVVIEHIAGKGKYSGQLGALRVKTANNITFKIGTGFSNSERQNPPKLGSTITFKFIGKTKRGVPRFASFMRVRNDAIEPLTEN